MDIFHGNFKKQLLLRERNIMFNSVFWKVTSKYRSPLPSVSPPSRDGCQPINRADKYDKQIFIPINVVSKFTPKLSHLLNELMMMMMTMMTSGMRRWML